MRSTAAACARPRTPCDIFDAASEYLDSDAVFAVKPSLVRSFVERSADDPERPPGIDEPWASLELELVLAPAPTRAT